MPWEHIFQAFFIAPFIYCIHLECERRANIAEGMAKDWLQTNYTGCYICSMESPKWSWPVVVKMKVYTSKNEDFDIKLKIGSFLAGIFNDKVHVVYIRRIKPT